MIQRERIFVAKSEADFLGIPKDAKWVYREIKEVVQPTRDSKKRGTAQMMGCTVRLFFGGVHCGKSVIECWRIEQIRHPEKGKMRGAYSRRRELRRTSEYPCVDKKR